MTESSTAATDLGKPGSTPFRRIICGIDDSRSSPEAARQACVLAGDGATLSFVTVAYESGVGLSAAATIGGDRARTALEEMKQIAAESGVSADSRLIAGRDPARELLAQAAGSDLLVVASHGTSRRAGIMLGSVASTAIHRGDIPVLLARRPPGRSFPSPILIASDESPPARRAVRVAGRIARCHGAAVTLLHVGGGRADDRHALAVEAVELEEATGTAPVVRTESGEAHERITELAEQIGASLVVVGSRGLTGLKALGSVSERVAHRAPCSVLVDREQDRDAGAPAPPAAG